MDRFSGFPENAGIGFYRSLLRCPVPINGNLTSVSVSPCLLLLGMLGPDVYRYTLYVRTHVVYFAATESIAVAYWDQSSLSLSRSRSSTPFASGCPNLFFVATAQTIREARLVGSLAHWRRIEACLLRLCNLHLVHRGAGGW
jgi:hypothetical protein